MALAYGSSGIWEQSEFASAHGIEHPAGVAAGDLLVTMIAGRYSNSTVSTTTGWTSQTDQGAAGNGGTGTNGPDTGTSKARIFSKEAAGGETGEVAWACSGNNFQGIMSRFTKSASATWDLLGAVGVDTSVGTDYSAASATTLSLQTGDIVQVITVVASDAVNFSDKALSAPGVTFDAGVTDVADSGSALGSDQKAMIYRATITNGTPDPVTVTFSSTLAPGDAGCTAFLRIREVGGAIDGTTAFTLPAMSANIDGSSQASGSTDSILPVLTAALDGEGLVVGTVDAQLIAISSALDGDARAEGTAANVLPSLVASVAGELSAEAVLNGQLPAITSSVDGEASLNGTVDAALPAIDSVISGDVVSTGDVAFSLPVLSTNLTGTSETPQNSLDVMLPVIEAALIGDAISTINLDASLPLLTASLSGSIPTQGTVTAALPLLAASLAGVVEAGAYEPVEKPFSSLRANLGTATVRPNKAEAIPQ